jgi:hypothetical protein
MPNADMQCNRLGRPDLNDRFLGIQANPMFVKAFADPPPD